MNWSDVAEMEVLSDPNPNPNPPMPEWLIRRIPGGPWVGDATKVM